MLSALCIAHATVRQALTNFDLALSDVALWLRLEPHSQSTSSTGAATGTKGSAAKKPNAQATAMLQRIRASMEQLKPVLQTPQLYIDSVRVAVLRLSVR